MAKEKALSSLDRPKSTQPIDFDRTVPGPLNKPGAYGNQVATIDEILQQIQAEDSTNMPNPNSDELLNKLKKLTNQQK